MSLFESVLVLRVFSVNVLVDASLANKCHFAGRAQTAFGRCLPTVSGRKWQEVPRRRGHLLQPCHVHDPPGVHTRPDLQAARFLPIL